MIFTKLLVSAMVMLLIINYLVIIGHYLGTWRLETNLSLGKSCIPFYGIYRAVCPRKAVVVKKKKTTVKRKRSVPQKKK